MNPVIEATLIGVPEGLAGGLLTWWAMNRWADRMLRKHKKLRDLSEFLEDPWHESATPAPTAAARTPVRPTPASTSPTTRPARSSATSG